jgi:hypothetical protein
MTTDAYGGESPSKKIARNTAWSVMRFFLGERFAAARYMILCGPENADARWLRAHGADPHKIVCVDHDASAISSAKQIEPSATYMALDALAAAKQYRRRFDCLMLDYCAQLNPRSIAQFARTVSWAARDGAVVCGAFSYGREVGEAARNAEQQLATVDVDALVERGPLECGDSLAFDDEQQFDVNHASRMKRYITFIKTASPIFGGLGMRYFPLLPVTNVAYVSRTMRKVGTPMIYLLGRIDRRGRGVVLDRDADDVGITLPPDVQDMNERVRQMAVIMARRYGSAVAADAFNLKTAQVAATAGVVT